MHLAPVPLFFASKPKDAIFYSGESSRTTHQAIAAIDACRYLGAIIVGAIQGASKDEILSNAYTPVISLWSRFPLCQEIQEIAGGSFKRRFPPEIRGSGYVVNSLEAALWAFHQSHTFEDGSLLAVNLGEDADSTGAIYGQLAGGFYGYESIPAEWLSKLAHKSKIMELSDLLYSSARIHE